MDSNELKEMLNLVVGLAIYGYICLCLQMMAAKIKEKNLWQAWIPFVNLFLFVKIANKSYWYILLFFIPLVNIVVMIYLWMEVAKRMSKPGWIGLLMIVPVVNLAIPAYLAFSK